jgi:hypothetical protein
MAKEPIQDLSLDYEDDYDDRTRSAWLVPLLIVPVFFVLGCKN